MGPHCLLGAEMCTPSSKVFKFPHSLAPGYLLTSSSAPSKAAKALATLDGLCFKAYALHAEGLPLCSLKFIASPPVPKHHASFKWWPKYHVLMGDVTHLAPLPAQGELHAPMHFV